MAISDTESESSVEGGEAFESAELVSKKPSALPRIYEYVVDAGRVTPREIQEGTNVSKSVAHSNLGTLRDVGLVQKVERGVYQPSPVSLEPAAVHALGELRSTRQFQICEAAAQASDLEVRTVADHLGMTHSNVRNAVLRLEESGFLAVRREPFENSRERYRLTDEGARALAALDVEEYRGWDWRETVAHETGIEGTAFRTAYEVEDANYLADAGDGWIHPQRVASSLGKNVKKTQLRFSKMAERGLLERDADDRKMVFDATGKTRRLFDELELYRLSIQRGLDLYSVATNGSLSAQFTMDELYAALVGGGAEVTIGELDGARDAVKRAGLLEGNPLTGYSFTIG
jgi:DNA-binding MarR family transcriptional regulator/ribosomal protein S25